MAPTLRYFSNAPLPCDCGCGKTHPARTGLVTFDSGAQAIFMTALAQEGQARSVWIALGAGAWTPGDGRDCFASVRMWLDGGQIACEIADRSPWKGYPIFTEGAARMLSRAEVLGQPGGKDWLFRTLDMLTELEPAIRAHLTGEAATAP